MNINLTEQQRVAAAADQDRFDLYTSIHKALRAWMTHVLVRVGQIDVADDDACAAVLSELAQLLDSMESHLHIENTFVHPLIEARDAGATAGIAREHAQHELEIASLRSHAAAVGQSQTPSRASAALLLYRELALFVAQNMCHMHIEETVNHQLLWSHYDDAELLGVHETILASLPPEKMGVILHWMIPSLMPETRAQMLGAMRATMPPPAFDGVLSLAQARLAAPDWLKLTMALGLPQAPGLVSLARR